MKVRLTSLGLFAMISTAVRAYPGASLPASLLSILIADELAPSSITPANQPMFNSSGSWLQADCVKTIEGVEDSERWKIWSSTNTTDAVIQLMAGWTACSSDKTPEGCASNHGTLSDFVWDSFHMNSFMAHDCSAGSGQGCSYVTCSDMVKSPRPVAGVLIADSIVNLKNLVVDQQAAITTVTNTIRDQISNFVTVFAPAPEESTQDKIFDALFDIFTEAIGMGVSSGFSALFKALKKSESLGESLGEIVNSGLDMGWDALKDTMARPNTTADIQNDLGVLVRTYADAVTQAQGHFLQNVMLAKTPASQIALTALMDDGIMLRYPANTNISTETPPAGGVQKDYFDALQDYMTRMTGILFGSMLPAAWGASLKEFRPFILRVDKQDYKCGDPLSGDSASCKPNTFCLDRYMSPEVAEKTRWCDPQGNSWFLLNARKGWCRGRFNNGACDDKGNRVGGHDGLPFQALDGGDVNTLDGKSYGGVSIQDIIVSSYTGFLQNNKQNGYTYSNDSTTQAYPDFTVSQPDDSFGLPFQAGVNTPGFFNFDICFNPQTAFDNMLAPGADQSTDPHVVCGVKPDLGTFTTDPSSSSFAPGWCGVHVTQYQMREGSENPLGEYQAQVTIKDNGGQTIGEATKEPAGHPLIVVDSVLPYQLIVAATGPVDDSPVGFWYADQFWDSNSQPNHCSFGAYDNGKREGDCGFTCNLPDGSPPPVSATIAHALPGSPTNAIGGPDKFTNTFSTTPTETPTPTNTGPPPPPPPPTYVAGWCGLHVTQYQRREKDINPTNDYEIEVTIYDAGKNPIAESGKVPAPAGQGVNVQGSLLQPVVVTSSDGDDYPLKFDFADQHWDSNGGCSTGKYDSGKREMDCGFSC